MLMSMYLEPVQLINEEVPYLANNSWSGLTDCGCSKVMIKEGTFIMLQLVHIHSAQQWKR